MAPTQNLPWLSTAPSLDRILFSQSVRALDYLHVDHSNSVFERRMRVILYTHLQVGSHSTVFFPIPYFAKIRQRPSPTVKQGKTMLSAYNHLVAVGAGIGIGTSVGNDVGCHTGNIGMRLYKTF